MTSEQTKHALNEEFKNVKYILTSSIRTKLLLALYKNHKNLDDLRKQLQKPSATILHGLKELETENLIKKNEKKYELTSNGYLLTVNMVKLIENWNSVNKNKTFWNNHNLSGIPNEILKNVYLLKDAKYVNSTTSDLSSAFNTYLNLISKAQRLKIILPIYSENHFKHIVKLLNEKRLERLELIISREIFKSIEQNDVFRKELLENEKVKVKCIKRRLKLFLTCSDEFMSLSLFFNDGHYDDSQILIGTDGNAITWALKLFTYY